MPASTDQNPSAASSPEDYDHIELTEEEIERALQVARMAKHYELKRQEYRDKIMAQPVVRKYTAEELFDRFAITAGMDVDVHNTSIVKNLCCYFAGDARFKGNLDKGLFLQGGIGVGKTTLMLFFSRNQRLSYRVISCREIEQRFSDKEVGEQAIRELRANIPVAVNVDPFGHREIGYCFDDLGTESNGKHYGKEKNVMAEVILNRYEAELAGTATHITTNLSSDDIKEQYGTRVYDRIREMFNVVQFNVDAKSRRK